MLGPVLVTGLLLVACGVVDVEAAGKGPCATDSDCVAGLQCHDQRVCVAANVAQTDVIVRLTPPADSGLVLEHFQLAVSGEHRGGPHAVVLTEPAVIRGTIWRADLPLSVPGTLLAVAPGDISGFDLGYNAVSTPAAAHSFELRVQSGHTYDLSFWPQSPEIPPHYSTMTVSGSVDGWEIELPAAHQLRRVKGRFTAGETPLAGLSVALDDPKGRLCSTRAVTDAEGRFELLVDPDAPSALLRFEPADPKDALPRGRLAQHLNLAPSKAKGEPLDLATIELGPIPPPIDHVIQVRSTAGAPVPGAYVRVVQLLPLPKTGTYKLAKLFIQLEGYAQASGDFEVALPPVPATVSVVPGPKSDAGRSTWKGALTGGVWQLTCPDRVQAVGRVIDYASRAVPAAQVVLRRLRPQAPAAPDLLEEAKPGDPIEAVTDGTGTFHLHLDSGSYAVWVQPAPGGGLARELVRVVEVTAGGKPAPWPDMVLHAPIVLSGKVLRSGGAVVGGVLVDVLAAKVLPLEQREPDPRLDPALSAASLDAHLLATAVSGGSGQFEVLLAPGQIAP